MQSNNQIFNDTYFCTKILVDSTRLRDTLEKNRDIEIDTVETEEEKQEILNIYKKKLQSIYRIRNNAFSFLLKNGFQCTYEIDESDQSKIFYMNIEGTIYDAKEGAIKNVLGKEYEIVAENCFSKAEFEQLRVELEKEKKELIAKKEEAKQVATVNTEKKNKRKEKADNNDVNDLLDLFVNEEINVPVINTPNDTKTVEVNLEKNNVLQETLPEQQVSTQKAPVEEKVPVETAIPVEKVIKKEEKKPTKVSRCPRCFAPLSEGQTICDFCGYDINAKKLLTKEELQEIDDTDEFSEDDIDKMFEELERRLNEEKEKSTQEKVVENSQITSQSQPATPAYFNDEDLQTVKLYNPKKSEPSKKRSELIMDIYTLKLKDPKIEDTEERTHESSNKRVKKSDYIAELNSVDEEEDDSNEIIREVKIYVYPLSVPETGNEISSEILVYITQDGACGSFCSSMGGVNSVKVNTNIHNFIVRGQWCNGAFTTKIFANGKTLSDGCEVDRVKEEIRPENIIDAKLGHPITFLSVEYLDGTETMKIHAVPLSETNDTDGYCKALYLMENVNLQERNLFITKSTNYIAFEFEDEVYKATSKWQDDVFKMKVENY